MLFQVHFDPLPLCKFDESHPDKQLVVLILQLGAIKLLQENEMMYLEKLKSNLNEWKTI